MKVSDTFIYVILVFMGRAPRSAVGNMVYHVLNRANGRLKIFQRRSDYQAFEKILGEVKEKQRMRILAFCLMPNHWHLILHSYDDGDLSRFMQWITTTHTQRWHASHKTVGYGHLYQGRYKSFPVQQDRHFLQLARYVERNARRAGLVKTAEDWPWSSLYKRVYGKEEDKDILSSWPIEPDDGYLEWVNTPQPKEKEETEIIRYAIKRGRPYGGEDWVVNTSVRLGLETTMRTQGGYRRDVNEGV